MVSQGVRSLVLLPIHAPSDLTASPSSAILILSFSGVLSSWWIFRVLIIFCRWAFDPIGMISVLSNRHYISHISAVMIMTHMIFLVSVAGYEYVLVLIVT
jgi:hypothetical protein